MQQYKYIKGSAEDFVGAPEWAAYIARNQHGRAFVSRSDHKYSYIDGEFSYMKDVRGDFIKYPWPKAVEIIAQREPIPEWNGDGLPPVGAKVEFYKSICYDYSNVGFLPETGDVVEVVAHKVTTDGNPVAVVFWDDKGAGRSNCFVGGSLAPLRTEAERKREEAVAAMINQSAVMVEATAGIIYRAIADGKIPGIKLD